MGVFRIFCVHSYSHFPMPRRLPLSTFLSHPRRLRDFCPAWANMEPPSPSWVNEKNVVDDVAAALRSQGIKSSESSGTFGGIGQKKRQLKATSQMPFKLRTEDTEYYIRARQQAKQYPPLV